MTKPHEQVLFDLKDHPKSQEPVECLGMTFDNDDARREHFTGLLREKLKDPEFRKIEGFPVGKDEDILALSDPPYYTACPNPWIGDFIEAWENAKPQIDSRVGTGVESRSPRRTARTDFQYTALLTVSQHDKACTGKPGFTL